MPGGLDAYETFSPARYAVSVAITEFKKPAELTDTVESSEFSKEKDAVISYTMGENAGVCSVQKKTDTSYRSDFLGADADPVLASGTKDQKMEHLMERAAREVETFRAMLPADIRVSTEKCYGIVITRGQSMPDDLVCAIKAYCEFNGYPMRDVRNGHVKEPLKLDGDFGATSFKQYLTDHQDTIEKKLGMLIGGREAVKKRLEAAGSQMDNLSKLSEIYEQSCALSSVVTFAPQMK